MRGASVSKYWFLEELVSEIQAHDQKKKQRTVEILEDQQLLY